MADKKFKVLLIEDEEMLANMYEVKFKNEGFDLVKALDGAAGLKLAKEEKPDFILLDIIMPKMDGFSVLKTLKEDPEMAKIPVILLTNLGQEEDIDRGKKMGAIGYLVKANITPAEVVAEVKKQMDKSTK
ncbi:MAG: response regulator [Parcubacteria group bacterium]|nr:MAG: response regulator [Parcubacteria group bacterium]